VAVCCCSEPGVLDGNDGLRGEVLDQLDLLAREWPLLLAVDDDRADKVILLQHRCDEQRASARQVGNGNRRWGALEVSRRRPSVADVDDLLRPDDVGMSGPRIGAKW